MPTLSPLLTPGWAQEFIGKAGWGGYTWNHSLFANVSEFVDYLHGYNIKLSINFHPDNGTPTLRSKRLSPLVSPRLAVAGIDVCQAAYRNMSRVLGSDPAAKATLVDFDQASENQTYSDAYFQYVIAPTQVDYR